MNFRDAFKAMKEGKKVKLPSWSGYWAWENGTIMMHCKDGAAIDLRDTERPQYTFENMASDDFVVADGNNCPELGGVATFDFGETLKYLKRGMKVTKQSWHKSGMYLELQVPDAHSKMTAPYIYITIDGNYRIPWHPSQADVLEEDWTFFESGKE